MKILALGSHPDDIEYGCGGMLLLAVDSGHEVFLNVMTDGTGVSTDLDRVSEQEAAAKVLGATDLFWGGFQDTEMVANRELIVAIEDTLKKVTPGFVLVNAPNDAQRAHKALGSSANIACRYGNRVVFYNAPTTHDLLPATFVVLGTLWGRKL